MYAVRIAHPRKELLVSEYDISTICRRSVSDFRRSISKEARDTFVESRYGDKAFNGDCVRLEELSEYGVAYVSDVEFYDFLTTNLLVCDYSDKHGLERLGEKLAGSTRGLQWNLCMKTMRQPHDTFSDILAIKELANAVAVSVSIKDKTGRTLVVQRGGELAVGSGLLAVACTGSLKGSDLDEENPFVSCAMRELKEELNLECDLRMGHTVITKNKLQPVVLLSGKLRTTFEDVYEDMTHAADFNRENVELYAVPNADVLGVVKGNLFSDVSAYQLVAGKHGWCVAPPVNIARFKLGGKYADEDLRNN